MWVGSSHKQQEEKIKVLGIIEIVIFNSHVT